MSIKVALASTDGKVVNEHFGRASGFLIFDISGTGFEFVKRVEVKPACDGGSMPVPMPVPMKALMKTPMPVPMPARGE